MPVLLVHVFVLLVVHVPVLVLVFLGGLPMYLSDPAVQVVLCTV